MDEPPHSHSMVLSNDNALIYQRKAFAPGKEPTPRSVRNLRF